MLPTCYLDTEGPGLYCPSAIYQLKFDYSNANHDDKPFIYNPWHQPAAITRQLIEEIMTCRMVAHNITFDHQKLQQFYNAISSLRDYDRPIDFLSVMPHLLYKNRSKFCLKPAAAVCTLLLCQKTLGGSSLAAKEIRVRKLPHDVAEIVASTLNKHTKLPEILFARRNTDVRWATCQSDDGEAWSDVALKFGPSNALKDVAKFVLGVEEVIKLGEDLTPPPYAYEVGYAPYAVMLRDPNKPGWHTSDGDKLWPELMKEHIEFWTQGGEASKYALDQDIGVLIQLDEHLGKVDTDFDSELACQVASVRCAGFDIDHGKLQNQITASTAVVEKAEINVDSHVQVRKYIEEGLDAMEYFVVSDFETTCNKATLKKIAKAFVLKEEEECCKDGCTRCDGKGSVGPGPMPVVHRAEHVLDIRKHRKRLNLYKKLELAGGAFPSFRVIGTKSGRMSGADGLNYHGIDGSREIREIFTLAQQKQLMEINTACEDARAKRDGFDNAAAAEEAWVVCGGDMNSQELAIAAAVMQDEDLGDILRDNKKLHAIFAEDASGIPYDQIMKYADDKTRPESKVYTQGKITCYSILYGASAYKVAMDLECTVEEAQQKINAFFARFPYMVETRKMVKRSLEALRSDENGRLVVVEPQQMYIESCFGFRRSFECEYAVMSVMIEAMHELKHALKDLPGKVIRKEKKGEQTLAGACVSALYGAVFSLQGKVLRAALNHLIQSAGRTCTLRVQKRIWDEVQPVGVHPFLVKLMSVHDEIITTSPPDQTDTIAQAVKDEMLELTNTVPLLSLDWATNVGSWYGAKAAVASLDDVDEEDRANAVVADSFVRCGWEG